jgi:hypothetical protein
LEQHNFSNQKQVEVLQILNFALYKKQYPQDLCGIIDRKIQILQQPPETSEKDNSEVASIKVRSAVILEMLNQFQLGTAHNDLTKICKPVPKYRAETRDFCAGIARFCAGIAHFCAGIARFCAGIQCGTGAFCALNQDFAKKLASSK